MTIESSRSITPVATDFADASRAFARESSSRISVAPDARSRARPTSQDAGTSAASNASSVPTVASASASSSSVTMASELAASKSISRPGELLSKLQTLAQNQPEQFSALMTEASMQLKKVTGGGGVGSTLAVNKLAAEMEVAGATGSVAAIDPASLGATTASNGTSVSPPGTRAVQHTGPSDAKQQAVVNAISIRVEAALGLRPPPLGPWFPS